MSSLTLRIALAQLNCTVGDLCGNAGKISEHIKRARNAGARLVVFPEMAVSGYPPEDLLLKPSFARSCLKYVQKIATECSGIIAVIGFPEAHDDLYNSAAVIADREIVGICRKQHCYRQKRVRPDLQRRYKMLLLQHCRLPA